MKNQLLVVLLLLFLGCGKLLPKTDAVITYGFVSDENITEIKKKETVEVIKKRIKKFTRYVDVSLNSQNEIIVKLTTTFSLERLNAIILNEGKLDFWTCYPSKEMYFFMRDVDEVLKTDTIPHPFSSLVMPSSYDDILINVKDTSTIRQLLNTNKIKPLFKSEYKDLKFLFGQPKDNFVVLYGITSNSTGRSRINETTITEARQDYDQLGRPAISITMNEFGSHIWTTMTNDAYLNNIKIALTINDIVYSAPTVSGGAISGGKSQISGDFTAEEAQDISFILNSQKRIPKLKFISVAEIEN